MVQLSKDFNSSVYQTIPQLGDSLKAFDQNSGLDIVDNLRPIFLKYEVEKKVGVMLLHRHFNLKKDEILVEASNESKSVALPWKVIEGNADPENSDFFKGLDLPLNYEGIKPMSWKFDENGQIQPYEFKVIEAGEVSSFDFPVNFLQEVFEELKKLGALNIFGLSLCDKVVEREIMAWETTDPKNRANIAELKAESPDALEKFVEVFWTMSKEDSVGRFCRVFCYQVEYGHIPIHPADIDA